MKTKFFGCLLIGCLAIVALSMDANGQTRRGRKPQRGAICFDPNVKCKTTATFEPHDLPFRIPANAVIWESEFFYAVVLSSVRYTDATCETSFIPEAKRLEAQVLFPDRKVFASRCAFPGNLFYTGVNQNANFMAVYAGRTATEAARILASVRATGKFPYAYVRRMSAGFNGT